MVIPTFRLREAQVYSRQVHTRMPFRFGRATMTQMPVLHLRLEVEGRGGEAVVGVSASGIPPLWFDKGANKTHTDNILDLSLSLRLALEHYMALDPAPVWFLHRVAEPAVRAAAAAKGLNELTAGFGIALVDAALVDAACREAGVGFHGALRTDLFGMGPHWASLLPPQPAARIAVRHTVGLSDPLVPSDITHPVGDGLPETLEAAVRSQGLGYFKIKIPGDDAEALDRLRRVASVLDAHAGDYRATLDGNEQFRDMDGFASFMSRAAADEPLQELWKRTLWIEQPVERKASLRDEAIPALRVVSAIKPVILDEADGDDETAARGLAMGYRGVSAKNCKGVFRSLNSYKLMREMEARVGQKAILSSEDLSHVPVVPLHQELCVAAALGLSHCERNGHHYFVGFAFLSEREQAEALREFPSLYRTRPDGPPVLRIEEGHLDLREINRAGFGTRSEPDWEALEPVRLPDVPADIIEDKRSVK